MSRNAWMHFYVQCTEATFGIRQHAFFHPIKCSLLSVCNLTPLPYRLSEGIYKTTYAILKLFLSYHLHKTCQVLFKIY